jgi:hypothetical protein
MAKDQVFFKPLAPFDHPPQFALHDGAQSGAAREGATPYQMAMVFAVGAPPVEVVVHHWTGDVRVPVLVADDPEALDRREAVRLVPLATVTSRPDNALPPRLAEMLERDGEPVSPPMLWPLRLDALFEGRLERAPADPRRATGYSNRFDFGEAFRDALRALPGGMSENQDTLTTVHVTDVGALIGGTGGFERMFVSVLAY